MNTTIAILERKAGAAEFNMNAVTNQIALAETATEKAVLRTQAEAYKSQLTQHLKAIQAIQSHSTILSATVSTVETTGTLYETSLLTSDMATPQLLYELDEVNKSTGDATFFLRAADKRTRRIARTSNRAWDRAAAAAVGDGDEDALLAEDTALSDSEPEDAEEIASNAPIDEAHGDGVSPQLPARTRTAVYY